MNRKDWLRNAHAVGYAMYLAHLDGKSLTLSELADRVGMSKNTTRNHIKTWIASGFVRATASEYRSNTVAYRYDMPDSAVSRYAASGYIEIGKEMYGELMESRRRKLIASLQSLVKQLELAL